MQMLAVAAGKFPCLFLYSNILKNKINGIILFEIMVICIIYNFNFVVFMIF